MTLKNLIRLLGYPALFIGGLYSGQDKLLLHPTVIAKATLNARPTHSNAWLEASKFYGLVYEPALPAKGTVLMFHGNAGAAYHRDPISEPVLRAGFRLVLYEYPGFGEREGKLTVKNLKESALQDFKLAHARWPGPLYIMGESLGSGIAAQVAGSNPGEVAGVVLFTPWDSLGTLVDTKFFGLPVHLLLDEPFDSVGALQQFQGTVTVVGAKNDTLIPIRHAKTLAKGVPNARYLELDKSAHNDWFARMTVHDWTWTLSGFNPSSPDVRLAP
ncbi:MAG: alpha/beta hydrolase [Agitococcus sp.]|nr:alpha/beta hydrolase [Agitococcus sp.]